MIIYRSFTGPIHLLSNNVRGLVSFAVSAPCQEIDISRHKLSQNDNFVSKYPSSVTAILKPRFRDHVTPIFQPTPISDPGPLSSWASTWYTRAHTSIYETQSCKPLVVRQFVDISNLKYALAPSLPGRKIFP